MGDQNIRTIEARLEVSFGNEEIAGALSYDSEDANPISNFACLYNNKHTPTVSAFTLEGNPLSEGRKLIDPEITGWWSTALSGETKTENNGYAFANVPRLTINLGTARPMKLLQIYGDPQLVEYPVKVRIKLFRETEDGSGEANAEADYVKEFVISGEMSLEERVRREIDLVGACTEEEIAALGVKNGYITGVLSVSVEILEWNKPRRVSKIYRCYDDIIERYEADELKSFECLRELPNSGEISYGLVSGSCSATLLNNKSRKFDLGYLKDMAHINRRIVPYINKNKLGSFYIKEWHISQDDMFVKCDANDRLMDFQDITFEGRMPRETDEHPTMSFKELFVMVLESANKNFVKSFSYEVDETLSQWSIEPYLPRESIWDVLQMLCEASMSFIYVDKNDVIRVKSELVSPQTPAYTKTEEDGKIKLTYADAAENDEPSKLTIDPDNAFSISVPFFADMETNQVEIGYYRKVIKEDQELYRENNFSASIGTEVEKVIEVDKYCNVTRVRYKNFDYDQTNLLVIKDSGSDFKYKIVFTIQKHDSEDNALIVYGQEITFEKQALVVQNDVSLRKNALSLYTHPDCELIQSKDLAERIAARVMAIYPSGTRTVTSEWRGDEQLNLFDHCDVKDRFGGRAQYMLTSIKNSADGGFRQEIKGIRKRKINEGSYR